MGQGADKGFQVDAMKQLHENRGNISDLPILKDLRTEIYDGKTTFARQIGTYPLIVGIKGRLELDKFIDVKITGHMLRSIVGEEIKKA